ncbi:hypothetical protein MKW98_010521 [Papaver atlanticum]|uniref:Uncharacterized protein n=1 Tax=Papaver atlanticum TaxID=357466 RepID=A0AAD4S2Q9_9MAGN|nr:hypothetical protein MKW98_010521 [Papaver atlanticum]
MTLHGDGLALDIVEYYSECTKKFWSPIVMKENVWQKSGGQMYVNYPGIFQAGSSIWKQLGLRGLYAGYVSWDPSTPS